jgi:hypothetical protein
MAINDNSIEFSSMSLSDSLRLITVPELIVYFFSNFFTNFLKSSKIMNLAVDTKGIDKMMISVNKHSEAMDTQRVDYWSKGIGTKL